MLSKPKILIVDDEPRMCESTKVLLSYLDYYIMTANSGREALECMAREDFDVVLLDIVMPDITGYEVMDHIKELNSEICVIVITGNASIDSAVGSLRRGAYDYLRKPFESDELIKTVQNALEQKQLRQENRIINGKLAQSEERYRFLVQNSPDIIYTLDENGDFTFINEAVERLLCFKVDELIGRPYTEIIYGEDLEKAQCFFNEKRTGERAARGMELRLKVNNEPGQFKHCEYNMLPVELKSTGMYDRSIEDKYKKYIGTYGVIRDISGRKELEQQLQHSQRMEALGTLGGGIAHDFNNLLMGIQGNTSMMLLNMNYKHPHYTRLKNIESLVQSGANLTKQLLGFARGGKYEVRSTNLNMLVKKSLEMFGRAKKEIQVSSRFQENIWGVEADQGQIEQVLLNLYVNAWQAMPEGGDLVVHTENVYLGTEDVQPYNLDAGRYVRISVTDTGTGMDEITQERMFEPFFTTKEIGRGTGLGLASAYGIIKNHEGFMNVESEKGIGTTLNVFLPASERIIVTEEERNKELLPGSETILLVDDEEMVIDVGQEMIKTLGYEPLAARSGKEALEVFRGKKDKIDMVILDMIMPEMGGRETFEKLKGIEPNIKVLLSSGYSVNEQTNELMNNGCDGFIQKPFSMSDLSYKLREILQK